MTVHCFLVARSGHRDARSQQLITELRNEGRGKPEVRAGYAMVLSWAYDLSAGSRLHELLDTSPEPLRALPAGMLLVGPRAGTQSPWSSKAGEILQRCGLGVVERVERFLCWQGLPEDGPLEAAEAHLLCDRMTESRYEDIATAFRALAPGSRRPLGVIELGNSPGEAIAAASLRLGLGLSGHEVAYLAEAYLRLGRDPTDVELMMFAQANSEHCRHKTFNAAWTVDGEAADLSLFGMIRTTHARHPNRVLVAYRDNASVSEGYQAARLLAAPADGRYQSVHEAQHLVAKVETHNHPTAISPHPGAATGAGGEIRDEGATGRGARPKAGLTGFITSHLRIPGHERSWEHHPGRPARIASALDIMLEGPLGAANYNNEFGRPALLGFFRTLCHPMSEQGEAAQSGWYGYHKPVMLAGGIGTIRPAHVQKIPAPAGSRLVVLGGPAMLIGLGGGAASSADSGSSDAELDFASVQRDNAEMERRCQAVIDACIALGDESPILSIHDVGAGGLSNALPELAHDCGHGAEIRLEAVPSADSSLSPLEIWCNEAQERYVLAMAASDIARFGDICARERCPWADVGVLTEENHLLVTCTATQTPPVDLPLGVLLGGSPRESRDARRVLRERVASAEATQDLAGLFASVLEHPTVADKTFLITIGDRSVGGQTVRDQMVGPWQLPVADCAITAAGFEGITGEAMATGERSPVAIIDPCAAARLAVTEAITNIAGARIARLSDVHLSANWMAACGRPGEDAALHDAVHAVALELCPALGINIPVGKDSLSMTTRWEDEGRQKEVRAPLTLVATAFAPVVDVRQHLTPLLTDDADSVLVHLRINGERARLGGSIVAQVCGGMDDAPADLDDPAALVDFFTVVQALNEQGLLLAYHDVSDGGLAVTLTEMALASRAGLEVVLDEGTTPTAALFSEEPGAVVQVAGEHLREVLAACSSRAFDARVIGRPQAGRVLSVSIGGSTLLELPLEALQQRWSKVSWLMRSRRDDADCADEEFHWRCDLDSPGLSLVWPNGLPFPQVGAPAVIGSRPRVAVLREQGVNGHLEMAAAFIAAGFEAVDVHMSDLEAGRRALASFDALVACGGFSYGDVLGAGTGWAHGILMMESLREAFGAFFTRPDTLSLGVCNGCQMLSQLHELIPGAESWPRFLANRSQRFESRWVNVEVLDSPSAFLRHLAGARLPVVVAHGEGRVSYRAPEHASSAHGVLRFVDDNGKPAAHYPLNPNGSSDGLTGFTSTDGRATILMPHPERCFRSQQWSWLPKDWASPAGPWLQMFKNAHAWLAGDDTTRGNPSS
jgi:phosphoribosylformylglycinamidine synthase